MKISPGGIIAKLGSRDILNCDLFFSPKLVGVGN
jgi:hypothetical protein